MEVVVTAARPPAEQAGARMLASEAARAAGNQGDAAKVVQSLPGVARAGAQGEPVVWGSAPNETGIFVDQVPLPALFHGSGLRSIVPTALLSTVRLTPGAYDVKFGRYLGGALELTTTDVIPFTPTLSASVDALDGSAGVATPVGSNSGLQLGARYGYVDRWLPEVIGRETAQLYAIPSYLDGHAVGQFALPNGDDLKIVALGAHDLTRRSTDWVDHVHRRSFGRLYAVYDHRSVASQAHTRVTPYLGFDMVGATTTSYGTDSGSARTTRSLGIRVDTTHTSGALQLNAGVDAHFESISADQHGSLTIPPREGDPRVFGMPPGRDYITDQVRLRRAQVAPYAELDFNLDDVRLTPGMRLETNVTELDRGVPASSTLPDTGTTRFTSAWLPRLAAFWTPTRRVHWFAVLSRHAQPADALDLGTLAGNPRLPPAKSTHLVVGDITRLSAALSVQVTLFHKWLTQLATRRLDAVPAPGRLLEADGRGRAWGSQTFIQLHAHAGWSGWLGVTLSQSRRQDAGETERPFDYDQPVSATLVVNKMLGDWTFGTRVRCASGFPRPRVTSAYADLQLGRFDPVMSSEQWWRMPAFFAVDLRAERRLRLGEVKAFFIYAELLNATNHTNVEEVAYSSDYTQRTWLPGMPRLAFLGVRTEL